MPPLPVHTFFGHICRITQFGTVGAQCASTVRSSGRRYSTDHRRWVSARVQCRSGLHRSTQRRRCLSVSIWITSCSI